MQLPLGPGDTAPPTPSGRPRLRSRYFDEPERSLEDAQHAPQIVSALQDQPGGRDHAVGALLARQPRDFLDPVEREFAGAPEDREHRLFAPEIHGVVAPFAGRHLAAVDVQDVTQFLEIEGDGGRVRRWG